MEEEYPIHGLKAISLAVVKPEFAATGKRQDSCPRVMRTFPAAWTVQRRMKWIEKRHDVHQQVAGLAHWKGKAATIRYNRDRQRRGLRLPCCTAMTSIRSLTMR